MREEWLDQLGSDAADEMNTSKEQALRQMVFESRLKRIYAKLKPIEKGPITGALSTIKVPKYEWFYHSSSDMLYHYVKGAFYAHAREQGVDMEMAPFRRHHTRRPLPKNDVQVAEVLKTESYFILQSTRCEPQLWEDISDSDEMERLLLNGNADHLRQYTVDGTPFTIPPLNSLFGMYDVNEVADKLL